MPCRSRYAPYNIHSTLSWLDNEQAAADSANFMANIKFDGIDEDLTSPGTPWIYYGVRGQQLSSRFTPHSHFILIRVLTPVLALHT
jgi:hypothetical protein